MPTPATAPRRWGPGAPLGQRRAVTPKPRLADGTLRFGFMWPNSPTQAITSRTIADSNPDILDPAPHLELAQVADRIGVDFVFFADGYTNHGPDNARVGHGEPRPASTIWAALLLSATKHIGVVTTMHARYLSPVVIARLGATLDALGGGRWGWNVVPGSKGTEEDLFGLEEVDHDARYEIADEAVRAVKEIWQADGEPIDFDGKHFHLRGTPNGPYPLQDPWPVIFNAGTSPAGQELIATHCDYAFSVVTDDLAHVRRAVEQLEQRVIAEGRSPLEVTIAGSVAMILGASSAEAAEKAAWYHEVLDIEAAKGWAARLMGPSQTYQSAFGASSFDEAARRIGMFAGSRIIVGTPAEAAEQLLDIHRQTGLRGFMLGLAQWYPEELELVGEIFPHLKRAGVWLPPEQRAYSW